MMSTAIDPRPSPARASMFRISHVLGVHREYDRRCIAEVQTLLDGALEAATAAGTAAKGALRGSE